MLTAPAGANCLFSRRCGASAVEAAAPAALDDGPDAGVCNRCEQEKDLPAITRYGRTGRPAPGRPSRAVLGLYPCGPDGLPVESGVVAARYLVELRVVGAQTGHGEHHGVRPAGVFAPKTHDFAFGTRVKSAISLRDRRRPGAVPRVTLEYRQVPPPPALSWARTESPSSLRRLCSM